MHFNSRYRYFSALATLLCLWASCYPPLSLRAIVPTGNIVQSWIFQSIPILSEAAFNGIIRWKLKSLADTIVVIIALFSKFSDCLTWLQFHSRLEAVIHATHCSKAVLPQTILVTLGHSKLKPDTDYLRHHSPTFTGRSHLHTWGYDTTASVARQYIL